MKNTIGRRILEHREQLGLTQDQFGAKYSVSGPAIFKFEKGYVKPSLALWLRIARDNEIDERRAVLMWIQAKLPEKYSKFIDLDAPATGEAAETGPPQAMDYSKYDDREAMRKAALKDKDLPKGMRALLRDEEVWELFRPTGEEINILRNSFGPLGEGTVEGYREALRLARQFMQATI